jgi:bisphosphoglycerate-dependent phosphoglycerate mutase
VSTSRRSSNLLGQSSSSAPSSLEESGTSSSSEANTSSSARLADHKKDGRRPRGSGLIFIVFCRKLTKDGLDDKVEKLKEFMADEIKKKLSSIDTVMISADGWSSKALAKYLCVYVVYLDAEAVL